MQITFQGPLHKMLVHWILRYLVLIKITERTKAKQASFQFLCRVKES